MPFQIDKKLVVGVSSTALFELSLEDSLWREKGVDAYKNYQREHINEPLKKGRAFPFIRRFLNINKQFPDLSPVEVVILSKNSPETGLRIFNSIKHYELDITRAAFTSGRSPFSYIRSYNISLFLSTDIEDVRNAISQKSPAGLILETETYDDEDDIELRIAFDFDGVLADDSAEQIYQANRDLAEFHTHEELHSNEPLEPGLMQPFFQKISFFQKLEKKEQKINPEYRKVLRTAIVTARNAPSHTRAIKTLQSWDVEVDEMFFLGGIEKKRVLEELKPHLYIDDQKSHLDQSLKNISLVHIPFGKINEGSISDDSKNQIT